MLLVSIRDRLAPRIWAPLATGVDAWCTRLTAAAVTCDRRFQLDCSKTRLQRDEEDEVDKAALCFARALSCWENEGLGHCSDANWLRFFWGNVFRLKVEEERREFGSESSA